MAQRVTTLHTILLYHDRPFSSMIFSKKAIKMPSLLIGAALPSVPPPHLPPPKRENAIKKP